MKLHDGKNVVMYLFLFLILYLFIFLIAFSVSRDISYYIFLGCLCPFLDLFMHYTFLYLYQGCIYHRPFLQCTVRVEAKHFLYYSLGNQIDSNYISFYYRIPLLNRSIEMLTLVPVSWRKLNHTPILPTPFPCHSIPHLIRKLSI